jgi:5'-3' exonuclease
MIASAVATNPLSPFVIVSGDADLYQLLRYERVIMFIPRSNALYTSSDFEEEYGIKPSRWSRVKAMAGCSSDDIPPVIPRVGEKTVIKFLTDRLTPARSKALKTQFETEDNMMIYTRNKFLTILPYVKTPPVVLEEMSLSLRAFRDVCLEYEFPSLLEEEHRWRDIIKKQ